MSVRCVTLYVTLSRATEADAQVLLDKTQQTMADFLLAQSPVNATGFAADEAREAKKHK